MRVEPFTVGSYVHVLKRGARGLPITNDDTDCWRFIRSLFYMNDKFLDHEWVKNTKELGIFSRPDSWPIRKPLVAIVCYTLMPNHFHLLLCEIHKGGVSEFMKKLGQSMTNYFNEKHNSKGSIFQGSYKSRTVFDDNYFRYVLAYIMVKNVFELYPKGGLDGSTRNFESAWHFALDYSFSSLGGYMKERPMPILHPGADFFQRLFPTPSSFKNFSRDVVLGRKLDSVLFE